MQKTFLDALAFLESIVFAQTFRILGHVLWIVRSVPIKSATLFVFFVNLFFFVYFCKAIAGFGLDSGHAGGGGGGGGGWVVAHLHF